MTDPAIPIATTDDAFLGGRLRVLQPSSGYRAGLDAVLLAAACPAASDAATRVLDCGTGVGVVALCVATRLPFAHITAIERDPALAALAAENAIRNTLALRVTTIPGDLRAPLSMIPLLASQAGQFDHVLANPPYYAHSAGTRSKDRQKDGSHAMPTDDFAAWARFAAAMARDGGSFTIIQRPEALPEILAALDRRFGRVRILPLHPRAGEPASRLLIHAIKGSRAGLQLLAGRILHTPDGHGFTPEVEAILRDGQGLDWGR